MKPAAWRLVVTATLFLGWLGYLLFLWQTTLFFRPSGEPIILSAPQILGADAIVEAELTAPHEPIVIKKVLHQAEGVDVREGETFTIPNIDDCYRTLLRKTEEQSPDFTGPGLYILPLRFIRGEPFPLRLFHRMAVAPIPPSPDFALDYSTFRIYPANDHTRAQLRQILP